ncbi:hypothetical protein EYF80_029006 [Liparis tanakae]|uniref:Uncharacterized protein n=1 Tax=Liparis tanakae TaxID=230148 RepID=A0A4Z2H7G6_9TELE|nr:hypothetical protein EYF80_029006 [Liparis tanakae]
MSGSLVFTTIELDLHKAILKDEDDLKRLRVSWTSWPVPVQRLLPAGGGLEAGLRGIEADPNDCGPSLNQPMLCLSQELRGAATSSPGCYYFTAHMPIKGWTLLDVLWIPVASGPLGDLLRADPLSLSLGEEILGARQHQSGEVRGQTVSSLPPLHYRNTKLKSPLTALYNEGERGCLLASSPKALMHCQNGFSSGVELLSKITLDSSLVYILKSRALHSPLVRSLSISTVDSCLTCILNKY